MDTPLSPLLCTVNHATPDNMDTIWWVKPGNWLLELPRLYFSPHSKNCRQRLLTKQTNFLFNWASGTKSGWMTKTLQGYEHEPLQSENGPVVWAAGLHPLTRLSYPSIVPWTPFRDMDVRMAGGIMGGMLLLLVTTLFLLIRWAKRRRRRDPARRGAVALGKHPNVVRAAPCTRNTHIVSTHDSHTHTVATKARTQVKERYWSRCWNIEWPFAG